MARDSKMLPTPCGRALGPDRGECELPLGHRDTWCRDALSLAALDYCNRARDKIEVMNVEPLRHLFIFMRLLGIESPVVGYEEADVIRREAWWLIWSGGI